MTRYVAVVGPGESASAEDIAGAQEVGRLLAQAGSIVLTGGLGGVMAAATEGANAAGGTTVALLPGTDRSVSSATVVIPTGLGELRNGLLVRAADAIIAVGGSWGFILGFGFVLLAWVSTQKEGPSSCEASTSAAGTCETQPAHRTC